MLGHLDIDGGSEYLIEGVRVDQEPRVTATDDMAVGAHDLTDGLEGGMGNNSVPVTCQGQNGYAELLEVGQLLSKVGPLCQQSYLGQPDRISQEVPQQVTPHRLQHGQGL